MSIAAKCNCHMSSNGICNSSVKECTQLVTTNTQPPATLEQIRAEATELAKNWPGNDAIYMGKRNGVCIGYEAAWKKYGAENAAKLHQAQQEIESLKRWKEEAKGLLNPVWEYSDNHLEVKPGKCKIAAVVEHVQKATRLLHEVLVMNEAWGDLPGEYINKVKTFLDGTK